MTQFKAEVFQNAYIPQGADEVNAIMTVTVDGGATLGSSGEKLIGIVCDTSGSMEGGKIHAAKDAIVRLVWMLPQDTTFFVIAGGEIGELIVPSVRATNDNKQRAIAAIKKMKAIGGTCISTGWPVRSISSRARRAPSANASCLPTAKTRNRTNPCSKACSTPARASSSASAAASARIGKSKNCARSRAASSAQPTSSRGPI